MAFDPNQPFTIVEEEVAFDPTKPFSIVSEEAPVIEESSGVLRQAADIPLKFAQGGISSVKSFTDLLGADNAVSKELAGYEKWVGSLVSAESKNDDKEIASILKDAENKGVYDKVIAGLEAFAKAPLEMTAQSVGYMVPQLAAGALGKAAQFTKAGIIGTQAALGFAQGVGQAKGDIYQSTLEHLREQGVSEDKANSIAVEAQSTLGKNLDQILLSGGLNALASTTGAEAIATRILTKQGKEATGGAIKGLLKGVAAESPLEAGQSAQQEVAKNVALQREGFDVPTFKGAIESATTGAVAGAFIGGPLGAFEAMSPEQKAEVEINKEANRKARDLEAPDTASQAIAAGITNLERGIDNKRKDLDLLESTSPEASKLRLDIAADQKLLAQAKEQANKLGLSETITETEKQQIELAKEITATEVAAPITPVAAPVPPAPTEVTTTQVAVAEAATPVEQVPPKVENVSSIPTPEESKKWDDLSAYQKPIIESQETEALDILASKIGVKRQGISDVKLQEKIITNTHPDDIQDALVELKLSPSPTPVAETPPVTEAPAAEVVTIQRDVNKPEQMTPEELWSSRYKGNAPSLAKGAEDVWWNKATSTPSKGSFTTNPMMASEKDGKFLVRLGSGMKSKIKSFNSKREAFLAYKRQGAGATGNALIDVIEGTPQKSDAIIYDVAVKQNKPISTKAVELYNIQLPEGYTKQGDLYVYQPAVSETITQPTTTKVGTDVMVEATPTPLEDRYTFEEIFNEAYKLFGETIPEKFSIMTDENQKFKAAYTLEDGAIEVNLAYMNKGDDIRTTIIHELGHYIYGDKDFRKYFDQFLASFNAKERAEIETYVESVYNKQTGELRLEEKQVRAFVERFVRDENASQWQGMLDAIKRFLNKLGFNFKFSNKDALAVFSAALDRYKSGQEIVRKGKTGKIAGQTKMMMAAEQAPIEPEAETITEAMAQGLDIGKENNMPINNKIESHIKNFAVVRGFFESASDRLRRAGFKKLATAIDDYYDQAQRRLGFANKILLPAFDEYAKQSKANKKKIDEEVKMFYAAQENKRDTAEFFDELNPITQKIVTAWQKFGEESGKDNQRIGIKVFDRGLQRYRPIGRIQKFFPRILKPEYKRALMEPDKYQKEYNEIVDALMKSGRIEKPEEAERYISNYEGTGTQQDYFSGIESARGQALPEELYDYSMQVMTDYVARWSQHASRIEQFGQKLGENSMTLWDRSRASTRDRRTIDYITAAQERIEGYFPNDPFQKGMAALNIWATGLQLGNPASAALNFLGGTTLNAMIGQPGAASSYVESLIELRKLGSNLQDAREKGIISRDLMNIVGDHQEVLDQSGIARVGQKTADFLLKWSGFTPVEQMIRTQSLIIGKSFLRKTLSSFAKNPDSSYSRQASTFLSRNNFDIDKLLVEQGSGPETDRLMRYYANISQGSYTITQNPIFIDTPIGKFLFKYQKFSTQVMRQAWKNTFEPAWKAVTFKGETMQLPSETRQLLYRLRLAEAKEIGDNRKISLDEIPQKVSKAEAKALTLIPVMMWLASAYVGGEAILRLRDVLFGVMMKGPDYEDILKALEDDEDDDELYLGLQRAWYNLIGIGALGLIGNYGQFFMDWQDRERVKNPLDPPALSLLKETGTLITNVADQGTLTKGDINNYLNRMSSMYRVSQKLYQTSASGLGFSDAPTVAEEMYRREVADINKYARRWAESAGLEYRTKRPMDIAPSKMTPINREISGYLQRNDPVTAAAYAKEYLKTLPKEDRKNAIQSMESGARNRQPLRLGSGPMDEAEKREFLKWVKTKVSPEKYAGIEKLSKQYETNRKKFLNRLPNR